MLSSIIFINMNGDVLIYRIYKDDISRAETFHYCTKLIASKDKKETPILYLDGKKSLNFQAPPSSTSLTRTSSW